MNGIVRKVFQRVVHPAHVPFEAETEAAQISGAGDSRPGSGLFGDGEDAGEFAAGDFGHALDGINGMEILAAPALVWEPLAGFPGVVVGEDWSENGYGKADADVFDETGDRR